MRPQQRLLIGFVVLGMGTVGYLIGRTIFRPSRQVVQPIAFNHLLHVGDVGMECDVCHEFYPTGKHAGLPSLETCLGCHDEQQTESPEEQKVRDLAAEGKDDVFRKLFRTPDNTYYSHRRHAEIAAIPCATCHGAIAETTAPPSRPLVRITMDFCLDCHVKHEVSDDCTRCHR